MAAAAESSPDKTVEQDCLLRAIETAQGGVTIDELRAQCQAEKQADENTEDDSFLATRIYTDDENVLRPYTLMAHRPNYFLVACYNSDPNTDPWRSGPDDSEPDLDNVEAQFQVSIKVPLGVELFSSKMDIFGAYTVRSFWQMYNKDLSAVFRETNHSPEVWAQFHSNWSFW